MAKVFSLFTSSPAKILMTAGFFLLFSASRCGAQDYYTPHTYNPPRHYANFKDTTQRKTFFFSVNAGLSIPLGGFGEKDTNQFFMIPTNTDSVHAKGFANVGFHINVKGGAYLTPNFGLLAKVGLSYNSFDANSLNSIINGYYYYSINGNYHVWQIMGGAFVDFPINESTSFKAEAMMGGIYANYPSAEVSNSIETISFNLSNASDFAYSFSVGIEQVINPSVSFVSNLTYSGAELNYPTATYTYSGQVSGTYFQHYPVSMSYGSFNISIGVLFHL